MHGNIEEIRQRLRGLSDDGLLEVNRDDLIESARQFYDEELAARSLTPRQPESAPPAAPKPSEAPEPPDELVSVGVFLYAQDANLAQSVLESAEIPCFQPDRRTLDIDPWLQIPLGGRRLMVPASRADQARELLAPQISEANKAIVRRWFEEVWNAGHGDAATEFGAGADERLRSLLPDLRVTVDDLVAEADKVVARIRLQGTRQGAPVEFHGVVFARLADGRIVDTWDINDAPADL